MSSVAECGGMSLTALADEFGLTNSECGCAAIRALEAATSSDQ